MASQAFIAAIRAPGDCLLRKQFMIGAGDYSHYLINISQIKRSVNLEVGTATVTVNNSNGTFNFLQESYLAMNAAATIKLYISGAAADLYTIFAGFLKEVKYRGNTAVLTLFDKGHRLNTKRLDKGEINGTWGTQYADGESPDQVMFKLLEYSGMDGTLGAGNPDIDWASFTAWRAAVSADYSISAQPSGQPIAWDMLKLCQITHSYAYIKNNGMMGFGPPHTSTYSYGVHNCRILDAGVGVLEVTNSMKAQYGYDPTEDSWTGTTGTKDHAASIAKYERYAYIEKSRDVWHETEASAVKDRDEMDSAYAKPKREIELEAYRGAILEGVANQITVTHPLLGFGSVTAIIREIIYDLENQKVLIKALRSW